MTPEDKEKLFRVASWVSGNKRIYVKTIRDLAETEENYLFIIREIDRVKAQLIHARTLGSPATLTLVEWLQILEIFNWQCAYCQSRPFQVMSHLNPLPYGGTTPDNCVPACYACVGQRKTKEHNRVRAYLAEMQDKLEQNRPDDLCPPSA